MLPEHEILVLCSRTRLTPDEAQRITQLACGGLDWERLLAGADRHGLSPLLFRHLEAVCLDAAPRGVRETLRASFARTRVRNLFLSGELAGLLNVFRSHELRAVSFKGPVLAELAYGDVALREFSDLDILVHPDDWTRAEELLVARGYTRDVPLRPEQEAWFRRIQHAHTFTGAGGRSLVELHWSVSSQYFPYPIDAAAMWGRLEPVRFAGGEIPCLAPADLLVLLCAHGAKHLWERLEWIASVAGLIRSCADRLQWEEILAETRRLKGERIVLLGAYLASDLLGAPVPSKVLERASAVGHVERLAARVVTRLLGQDAGMPSMAENCAFRFRLMDRAWEGTQCVLRPLLVPDVAEWRLLPLPSYLYFLYFPLRAVRLTAKYASTVFSS